MALPQFSMRELIEAGAHFGHKTKRWNPRMAPYLYGVRNDVHIIDLQQTVPLLRQALQAVRETVARNGRILFVGTKRQASDPVVEAAKRCGQYYINHRWLGGMLTNWNTIQVSIKALRKLDEQLQNGVTGLTKKEILTQERQKEKLERSLGGIKDMGGLPDLLVVIDTNKEDLAIAEARRLGIPIVAILDSNSSPDGITYPIPGNDDATRAIRFYLQLFSDAALDGLQESMAHSGVDLGKSEKVPFSPTEEDFANGKPAEKSKGGKKSPVVVKKASVSEKLRDAKDTADEAAAEAEDAAETAEAGEAKPKKTAAKKTAAKKTA